MRIVFDCRSVFEGMGGIGRAAACLAPELAKALPKDELVLLFGTRRPSRPLVQAGNARELQVEAAMIDPEFEQIRLPGLLEEHQADLYHGTCFAVPIAASRTRRIATVHDVVFRSHPELVEDRLRAYLDRWTEVSCDLADSVVTVSEFSRREIAAHYGRPPNEIVVVPNAVSEEFFRIARRPLAGPPYVLYVGALEAKKNIVPLLRGFASFLRQTPELPHLLALVGGLAGELDLDAVFTAEPGLRERVRLLGHVPDDQLAHLYGGASAFVYLSQHEGYGLPPLEAMAVGVPTLVANLTSLPEVTQGAAILVDPHDRDAVGREIARLVQDEALRAELVERGRKAARRFSWADSARKLAQVYKHVEKRGARALKVLAGGAV
ncbi:glycosyltransferase family 4 protein [bacterium]|nr:glycosyltransferase family 4 protein [bacterium]